MKIIFFGMGKKLQKINQYIGKAINRDYDVVGVSDSKILFSQGDIMFGGKKVPIVSLQDINNMEYDYVIIATSDLYVDEIYHKLLKWGIKKQKIWTYDLYEEDHLEKVKGRLLKKYFFDDDLEMRELISYLEKKPLKVFNSKFRDNYSVDNMKVFYDSDYEMYYTMCNGKRMYLRRSINTEQAAKKYVCSLEMEQDSDSPHCYLDGNEHWKEDCVVIDAGVAEGNFALSVIEKVKKIILIEADSEWVEALKITFEPYKDKVVIINKFLSDIVDDTSVTIDSLGLERVDFVKIDIEGAEEMGMKGMEKTLRRNDIDLRVCVYHTHEAEKNIRDFLSLYNANVCHTKGYMFFMHEKDAYLEPEFRRVLLKVKIDNKRVK